MSLDNAVRTIRERMDHFVIGQESVKEALTLALLGQEHLYLQGEPGCAKTLLAEVAGNAANLQYHFCQMHRDTRLSELVGDTIIRRERANAATQPAGGEVIEQCVRPGGLLTAEVAVLDDISRAPGEALNVLLRLLNEREYQTERIPLLTAVATSNPTSEEYYNEPLDPANLDRFTLQLKTAGSLAQGDYEQARHILDRYEGGSAEFDAGGHVDAALLRGAVLALHGVELPARVVRTYRQFLDDLRNKYGCDDSNSMLTDRTMLVKVPRMIKAMALMNGRQEATLDDLRVLKYILTFRVPEHIYENLEQILEQMIQEAEQQSDEQEEQSGEQMQSQADQDDTSGEGDAEEQEGGGDQELVDEILQAVQSSSDESEKRQTIQQQATAGEEGHRFNSAPPQTVENLEYLLEKIRGRLERNPADSEIHPGGSPRTYKRMRTFEEFMDTDPVDSSIWLDRTHPTLPRTYRREKKHMGGKVVIIRDVSQSMEGRYARWTSSVVTKLVELVRRKRMRIGYIEFNHVSRKYTHEGRFFTRDYEAIVNKAGNVSCSGVTNYQYPLRDALNELRSGGTRNKHILFLTDGEPTQGDWLVREERRTAKQLGVAIHTLFIGTTECPEILDILSEETEGNQFLATPDGKGGLTIVERHSRGERGGPTGTESVRKAPPVTGAVRSPHR